MRIYLPETSSNLLEIYQNCPATKTMDKVFFRHPATGELSCAIKVPFHLFTAHEDKEYFFCVSHLTGLYHWINQPKIVAQNATLYELNSLGKRVGENYRQCESNSNYALQRVKMILQDELESKDAVWKNLAEVQRPPTAAAVSDIPSSKPQQQPPDVAPAVTSGRNYRSNRKDIGETLAEARRNTANADAQRVDLADNLDGTMQRQKEFLQTVAKNLE